ncbi:hypothetical protein D3C73_1456860 [compost metagenome]
MVSGMWMKPGEKSLRRGFRISLATAMLDLKMSSVTCRNSGTAFHRWRGRACSGRKRDAAQVNHSASTAPRAICPADRLSFSTSHKTNRNTGRNRK